MSTKLTALSLFQMSITEHEATMFPPAQLTLHLFQGIIPIMKIDKGPFLNGEISIDGKAVIIKNCDAFAWSQLSIMLNYYYHYTCPNEIQPNETCKIEFSNFILPELYRNFEPPMPIQYDGSKTDDYLEKKHYAITLDTKEGHNYIDLFKKNTLYPFTSNRKNVIMSYTID